MIYCKYVLWFVFLSGLILQANAQATYFEGIIDYDVEVQSKAKAISNESMKRFTGMGAVSKAYIKKGSYFSTSGMLEEFSGPAREQTFIKFKQRDTLYYHEDDDSITTQIIHSNKTQTIAGYRCKSVVFKTQKTTDTYFYTLELLQEKITPKNKVLSTVDSFFNEIGAIWLQFIFETDVLILKETATNVAPKKLDDKIFLLPTLPVTKFDINNFITSAQYKSEKDWAAYLTKAINAELANKYIKIPKGETSARQTAIVEFVVTETGAIGDIRVVNAKEVHSALAKEAVRVIKESFGWKPATFNGQKIDSWFKQPITFVSSY